jgi:hypothetical protein
MAYRVESESGRAGALPVNLGVPAQGTVRLQPEPQRPGLGLVDSDAMKAGPDRAPSHWQPFFQGVPGPAAAGPGPARESPPARAGPGRVWGARAAPKVPHRLGNPRNPVCFAFPARRIDIIPIGMLRLAAGRRPATRPRRCWEIECDLATFPSSPSYVSDGSEGSEPRLLQGAA